MTQEMDCSSFGKHEVGAVSILALVWSIVFLEKGIFKLAFEIFAYFHPNVSCRHAPYQKTCNCSKLHCDIILISFRLYHSQTKREIC